MGLVATLAPWLMKLYIETMKFVVVPPKESRQKQLVNSTLDGASTYLGSLNNTTTYSNNTTCCCATQGVKEKAATVKSTLDGASSYIGSLDNAMI